MSDTSTTPGLLPALEEEIRTTVGVRLFTVFVWLPGRRVLHRVHSSHPDEYPVGGEKSVEVSGGWLEQCIERQLPYLGADRAAVREVFADHRVIDELGCGAVVNVPVVEDGRTLGMLNVLDAEGSYDEESVRVLGSLAARAVPDLRAAAERADGTAR
ncbi:MULTISPECIES: GAF domain-containing protein [unclassified Streptomyces]|uniref:GAF domain-containing protein n=1 Tax=unclassified Streptomyces TaxID=2593676 RepID=UPI000938B2AF|nr:GAF domain-containing protein [Streptomyces sp. CB02058]OKI97909.1 GAF sensor protein [Streptomyces sp. CB02058]